MVGNILGLDNIKRMIEERVQAIKMEISQKVDVLHNDNNDIKKRLDKIEADLRQLENVIRRLDK